MYGSGNPLKMIKEYKTQQSFAPSKKIQNSLSYASNSTKDQNEEMIRFNKIMHEPIDNLIANMDELSMPISTKNF